MIERFLLLCLLETLRLKTNIRVNDLSSTGVNYIPLDCKAIHCESYFWSFKLKGFWDWARFLKMLMDASAKNNGEELPLWGHRELWGDEHVWNFICIAVNGAKDSLWKFQVKDVASPGDSTKCFYSPPTLGRSWHTGKWMFPRFQAWSFFFQPENFPPVHYCLVQLCYVRTCFLSLNPLPI